MKTYEVVRRGRKWRRMSNEDFSSHEAAYSFVKRLVDLDIARDKYEPFTYCIREIDRGDNGRNYICMNSEVII